MAGKAARVVCMVGTLESRSSSATGLLGDFGLDLSSLPENRGEQCLLRALVVRTEVQVFHPYQFLLFGEIKTLTWAACRATLEGMCLRRLDSYL